MKRFLLQTFLFLLLTGGTFGGILFLADGYTDPYYLRFTTPKQTSLILGTSRAAQGLQPEVFKEVLNTDIYNYSFTASHSPYGPIYLRSIQKKINPGTHSGIFILAVDPWSIVSDREAPNDSLRFEETGLSVGTTERVDLNPNFPYLIDNLSGQYYKILLSQSRVLLHDDGWLEVFVSMDSASVRKRTANKIKGYRFEFMPHYQFSSLRLEYLAKTIAYLSNHGDVYLVRLPVHPQIRAIDQELMPDFETKLEALVPLCSGYFDMSEYDERFRYTDGIHLYKESGRAVSRLIAEWIRER